MHHDLDIISREAARQAESKGIDSPERKRDFMDGYEAGRKAERAEWEMKIRLIQAFLGHGNSALTSAVESRISNNTKENR